MKNKFYYLSALHFFNDGFSEALVLFLPFIALDFGLNIVKVGFLGTGLKLLNLLMAIPSVYVAKKFGSVKTLLLAMLFYGLGYFGVAGSHNFLDLLFVFIFAGIGFGLFHPVAFAAVSRLAQDFNIGRSIGNFTAWGDMGRIVVSGGLSFIIVALNFKITALIYGVVIFLALGYFYFRTKPLSHDLKNLASDHTFKNLWKNKKFVAAALASAIDNLASAPLILFLSFLLLDRGITPIFLSIFAVAYLVGNLSGRVIAGGWVDKVGSVKIFVFTEVVMAALLLLITLFHSAAIIAVIALVLGLVTRGTIPAARSLVHEAVSDSQNFEKSASVVETGNAIAAAVAPTALGFISYQFGINAAFWTCAGFALLAIVPALIFSLVKSYPQP